jgi:hypothetical protein
VVVSGVDVLSLARGVGTIRLSGKLPAIDMGELDTRAGRREGCSGAEEGEKIDAPMAAEKSVDLRLAERLARRAANASRGTLPA